jgi:hypothetical protein
MDIIINGRRLDYIPKDITLSWASFVFADAIADQYSTDIELPKTDNNLQILQAFGILYGHNLLGVRVPCTASIEAVSRDAYLQVQSVGRHSITATLFVNRFPFGFIDRKIRDIIHDQNYIKEWDLVAPTTYISGHTSALERSLFSNQMGVSVVPYSYRLADFLTALGTALGITFNFPFTEVFRVVAAKPRVSPWNTKQVVYTYDDGGETKMFCGQHVCTDITSPRDALSEFTITRDCKAVFTPYSALIIEVNGSIVHTEGLSTVSPSSAGAPYTHVLAAGDKVSISYYPVDPNVVDAVCLIEYSGYATDDTDTDELKFPGYIDGQGGQQLRVPRYTYYAEDCDGQGGRVRLSWAYMDYWWCLGDMTFRQLINSLCHLKGMPADSAGNTVGFGAMKEAVIGGDLQELRPSTQAVGLTTLLAWNKESPLLPLELHFAGDFLPDSVTVFQSVFYGANETATGVAIVPMFEGDTSTYDCRWKDCGAVMLEEISYVQGGNTYYGLAPLPPQKWLGVDKLTGTIEAEIETTDEVGEAEYVHFQGQKYVVISTEYDTDTSITHITAILL